MDRATSQSTTSRCSEKLAHGFFEMEEPVRNLTLMVRIAYEKVADALDLNIIKVDDAGDVIEHSLTGDKVDLALFAIGQLRTMIESLDQKYQDQFCGGKPH